MDSSLTLVGVQAQIAEIFGDGEDHRQWNTVPLVVRRIVEVQSDVTLWPDRQVTIRLD